MSKAKYYVTIPVYDGASGRIEEPQEFFELLGGKPHAPCIRCTHFQHTYSPGHILAVETLLRRTLRRSHLSIYEGPHQAATAPRPSQRERLGGAGETARFVNALRSLFQKTVISFGLSGPAHGAIRMPSGVHSTAISTGRDSKSRRQGFEGHPDQPKVSRARHSLARRSGSSCVRAVCRTRELSGWDGFRRRRIRN
jgi:hypothetical protein